MGGFSSIVGLSKVIADTLYEVINAVSTHAGLTASHGQATIEGTVGSQAKVDTHNALQLAHKKSWLTGSTILHSHDVEIYLINTVYTKKKTITLNYLPNTSLRIAFDIRVDEGVYTGYGRIYRNGVAVGTEQTTTSTAYTTKTEVIRNWSDGDTIELWAYISNAAEQTVIRNLRILYDNNYIGLANT